jgi:hypothetical protein
MIELDYRKPEPSGLALRLWFFAVGWSGFHLHFAILYPMLSWLRYADDAADTWLFVFGLVGFVLILSIVLLLVVKTTFLHSFLDQVLLVVFWFFLGLLGVPYVGSKVIEWWQLSTTPIVTVDDDNVQQTWDRISLYKLDGFAQLTDSQVESFVKRSKRNPRSGHTYEWKQRYWICPMTNRAGSALTFNIFMVNTKGLHASESYSPSMVSKLESNPKSIAVYDDLANKILQSGDRENSEARVYLGFFDLASRLSEYRNWALGSYLAITSFWFLICIALTRRA